MSEPSLLSRALYRGPSHETLHERYAKRGVIDTSAPVRAVSGIHVAAPPEAVWARLSALPRWPEWVPGVAYVRLGPSGVAPDAAFRWKLNGTRIRSTLAVVDPGRELCWTGLLAGTRAVHRFRLQESGGGTEVESEESIGGPFVALYFGSEKLQRVLESWLTALKTTTEASPS
ncbi:SRPBCC family protein [Streptomyces sp. NPDC048172]|uniref:SRPBCC family protein n=1 Tax=Streptomyces sp. NPDC048172 TaxID=3365505 RepID=UPI00370F7E78